MRARQNELIPKGSQGELALIDRIRRRVAHSKGGALRLGIGDDCAILRLKPGEELVVTTDLSIAGRHFRLEWHSAEAVGHRTLARGLSDIAAMGARPIGAFLSMGLPRELALARGRRSSWVDGFLQGFLALSERFETPLAGGDLAQSPIAVADIVLLGALPRGTALLRSGARPGDALYVTGALGGSAAGLELLRKSVGRSSGRKQNSEVAELLKPHLWPAPRIAQGLWLRRRRLATSAIDLSDGLSTDLDHLCEESGVSAEIDADRLPIHLGATLEQALHGGEDYELLFTVRSGAAIPRRISGVPVTQIGHIVKTRSGLARVMLVDHSGSRPLHPGGWEHFA
jgi:thiamine-monophosphate kinase